MANDFDGHHTLKKKLSDHGKALFRQSQGVEGSGQISPSTSFTAPPPKRQSQPPPRMTMAGGQPTRARPAVRSTMPPIREERAGGCVHLRPCLAVGSQPFLCHLPQSAQLKDEPPLQQEGEECFSTQSRENLMPVP